MQCFFQIEITRRAIRTRNSKITSAHYYSLTENRREEEMFLLQRFAGELGGLFYLLSSPPPSLASLLPLASKKLLTNIFLPSNNANNIAFQTDTPYCSHTTSWRYNN